MKLLDIYLVNDQMWMIVKSILFMLSAVAAITAVVFYVKRKDRYDFSKVSVISILAVSMSFLSLALIVGQPRIIGISDLKSVEHQSSRK